jgi:endonuclease G
MPSTDRSQLIRSYTASLKPGSNDESVESDASMERFADAALRWADRGRAGPGLAGKKDAVLAGYRALVQQQPPSIPVDDSTYEAIILPALRPVGDVVGGTFQLPDAGEFGDFLTDQATRARIEAAIRGVACLTLPKHPSLPYGGTCFVVGKELVMTNRHVAQIFSSGLGTKGLTLVSRAAVDPLREQDDGDEPAFEVRAVRMVHPYWDMALLEVPGLDLPPLTLDAAGLDAGRRRVAVIGYPAFDTRNPTDVQNTVFRGRFYVKRLSPGYVTGFQDGTASFENSVRAMTHDSSTLGGNSGSAVVDVATGRVLGLHFAGLYLKTNYAVPVAELARDRRVIDAGVTFTSTSNAADGLPSEPRWRAVDAEAPRVAESRVVHPPSAGTGATLRMTIPIEITITVGQSVTVPAVTAPVVAQPVVAAPRVAPVFAAPVVAATNGAAAGSPAPKMLIEPGFGDG